MFRIILAGILGGIVIFIAGAVIHVATPLGHAGIESLPNDQAVGQLLKSTGPSKDGFYIFPAYDMSKKHTAAEDAEFQAKYTAGPTGILIYHPTGAPWMNPKTLGTELATNIVIALLAAFIVSLSSWSFGQRVLVVTLFGLIAWVSISLSNWNWYGFPTAYILAEGFEQIVDFLLCGIVIAVIFRSYRKVA
jgi:hypothetical protein